MSKEQKRVTLKQAIALLDKAYGIDHRVIGKHAYSLGTLYNATAKSSGRLTNVGPKHMVMVEVEQLMREFGPKKAM